MQFCFLFLAMGLARALPDSVEGATSLKQGARTQRGCHLHLQSSGWRLSCCLFVSLVVFHALSASCECCCQHV